MAASSCGTCPPACESARELHGGAPVNKQYARVCFDKDLVRADTPEAAFICPGHPLLDAVIDLTLDSRDVLRQGAVLIDPLNRTGAPRLLAYLQHEVRDGRPDRGQSHTVVSRRLQFVEFCADEGGEDGGVQDAGTAPHLDYRAPMPQEEEVAKTLLRSGWLAGDLEGRARTHAAAQLAPRHVKEVRELRLPQIDKVEREVRSRLTREVNYWDARARELKEQERAGRQPRVNSQKARERADDLEERLIRRLEDLNRERAIGAGLPEVLGLALVVPKALLHPAERRTTPDTEARAEVERAAMQAVIKAERDLGREPRDVSDRRGLGYDTESKDPTTNRLRFIEVKGRWEGQDTVTLTRNEILASRNAPEGFRLALVTVGPEGAGAPRYVSGHGFREPGFAEVAVTFKLSDLLAVAREAH